MVTSKLSTVSMTTQRGACMTSLTPLATKSDICGWPPEGACVVLTHLIILIFRHNNELVQYCDCPKHATRESFKKQEGPYFSGRNGVVIATSNEQPEPQGCYKDNYRVAGFLLARILAEIMVADVNICAII